MAALCTFLETSQARVIDLFRRLDRDNNGQIDGAELVHGLQGMGLDLRPDQQEELMSRLDLDGDQQISTLEFLSQVSEPATRPAVGRAASIGRWWCGGPEK